MPTKDEFQELIDNCTWTYHKNGWVGYIVKSKTNGNQIILRAGGEMKGSKIDNENLGNYFSSIRPADEKGYWAYVLTFWVKSKSLAEYEREVGRNIRPVLVTK